MNEEQNNERETQWRKHLLEKNSEKLAFIFNREEIVNRKYNTVTLNAVDTPLENFPMVGDTIIIGTQDWYRYAVIVKISCWGSLLTPKMSLKYHFRYFDTFWYHYNETGEPIVFETEEREKNLYPSTKIIVDTKHRVRKYTLWNRLLLKLGYFGKRSK